MGETLKGFTTDDFIHRAVRPWPQLTLSVNPKPLSHNMKVIFSNPATILFVNGKKYVSKAHNEKFDEEKGLLMCLAKAQGISHLDLKRLLKNASRPNKKQSTKK